ncbi:MAG TPA: hypothetical protein VHA75_14380, partial [Rugosimonospora sp.]|nr:hypothetical protein [Rugosimonospora sp.]
AADPDNTVVEKTVKTTTTRRRPTAKGVEAETKTDVKTAVKVVAPDHHTVEHKVEHKTSVEHKEAAVPHQRAPQAKKKGLFSRLFGGD